MMPTISISVSKYRNTVRVMMHCQAFYLDILSRISIESDPITHLESIPWQPVIENADF